MIAGRARKMGLGPAGAEPKITLAAARGMAADARKLLMQGVDPIAERDAKRASLSAAKAKLTFGECAAAYIKANEAGWKNAKHRDQWITTLLGVTAGGRPAADDYCKSIRALPVDTIDTDAVLRVLQPIWYTKAETANRVRNRIELVLDYAKVCKQRDGENPARWGGHLKLMLPAKAKVAPVEHHAALPYAELPAFMGRLRARNSVVARGLEFLILTAARTNDVLGAKWSEVDLTEKTWTVPAARMKGQKGARKRDHMVPLSARALTILRALPREGDFVFVGSRAGSGMSKGAMAELLKVLAPTASVHGFRSSFKDWCTEQTNYPSEMSELALSHTISDRVEAAYRRGDMLEKRRRLMADWSAFCEGRGVGGDNVRQIRVSQKK
jgi:integrase